MIHVSCYQPYFFPQMCHFQNVGIYGNEVICIFKWAWLEHLVCVDNDITIIRHFSCNRKALKELTPGRKRLHVLYSETTILFLKVLGFPLPFLGGGKKKVPFPYSSESWVRYIKGRFRREFTVTRLQAPALANAKPRLLLYERGQVKPQWMEISNLPECMAQPACLLRCWSLSFLPLPPYHGCELLEYQQLSCKDAWTDRNKLPEARETETATLVPLRLKASLLFHTLCEWHESHTPDGCPPEWYGGMAPRDSQKGFTKVASRRPHQRKMKRQHRGRCRGKEKYTQDFLQLPTPLHPGTVF